MDYKLLSITFTAEFQSLGRLPTGANMFNSDVFVMCRKYQQREGNIHSLLLPNNL